MDQPALQRGHRCGIDAAREPDTEIGDVDEKTENMTAHVSREFQTR
jgi:hypothetical protein